MLICLLLFAIAFLSGRLFLTATDEVRAILAGLSTLVCFVLGLILAPVPLQIFCLVLILVADRAIQKGQRA